jgi:hypothetical protein
MRFTFLIVKAIDVGIMERPATIHPVRGIEHYLALRQQTSDVVLGISIAGLPHIQVGSE